MKIISALIYISSSIKFQKIANSEKKYMLSKDSDARSRMILKIVLQYLQKKSCNCLNIQTENLFEYKKLKLQKFKQT